MWIPNPIYEALPVIYPGIGVASVAMLGLKSPAVLSATLLCLASVAITVLRRRYRTKRKLHKAAVARSRRLEARQLDLP